jgi:hypothetical protein
VSLHLANHHAQQWGGTFCHLASHSPLLFVFLGFLESSSQPETFLPTLPAITKGLGQGGRQLERFPLASGESRLGPWFRETPAHSDLTDPSQILQAAPGPL